LFGLLATVAIVLVITLVALGMLPDFPKFAEPVMDRAADAPSNTYLAEGLQRTGAANIVTAVLLDFRAYDTLGEATVLFCSILGALTILRRKARKRREDEDGDTDAV